MTKKLKFFPPVENFILSVSPSTYFDIYLQSRVFLKWDKPSFGDAQTMVLQRFLQLCKFLTITGYDNEYHTSCTILIKHKLTLPFGLKHSFVKGIWAAQVEGIDKHCKNRMKTPTCEEITAPYINRPIHTHRLN